MDHIAINLSSHISLLPTGKKQKGMSGITCDINIKEQIISISSKCKGVKVLMHHPGDGSSNQM